MNPTRLGSRNSGEPSTFELQGWSHGLHLRDEAIQAQRKTKWLVPKTIKRQSWDRRLSPMCFLDSQVYRVSPTLSCWENIGWTRHRLDASYTEAHLKSSPLGCEVRVIIPTLQTRKWRLRWSPCPRSHSWTWNVNSGGSWPLLPPASPSVKMAYFTRKSRSLVFGFLLPKLHFHSNRCGFGLLIIYSGLLL